MRTPHVLLGIGATSLALLIGPCSNVSPYSLGSSGVGAATAMPEYSRESAKCQGLAKQEVVIQEERTVGGALAVRMVAEAGGLMLKPASSVDASALRDAHKVVLPKTPIVELNRYVTEVGKVVAAQSTRPELPWTFAVLDTPDVNAFSTPGGYVLVSRGLLAQLDNEAQLAGVLGHEIAHITERHHLRAYQKHKVDVCNSVPAYHVAQAAGISPSTLLASAVPMPNGMQDEVFRMFSANGGVLDLDRADGPVMKMVIDGFADGLLGTGFAQEQELEADRIGLELSGRAGYRTSEYPRLLHKLPKGTGFFAKHPPPGERAAALDKWETGLATGSFEHAALVNASVVVPHPKELKIAQVK